jgi:hypothetical protein
MVFLVEILRFFLIQRVLVDHNLAMECPWGVPTIAKVLCEYVERIGRLGVGFGGVDPRALCIPSYPGASGLTGALDRPDPVRSPCGICLGELLCLCGFGPRCCWSVLSLFGAVLLGFVRGFPSLQVVFWKCFLFLSLEVSLRILGTFVVRLL